MGVDIEWIRDIDILDYREFFGEKIYQKIERSRDKIAIFFIYWTLIESALKCFGCGIARYKDVEIGEFEPKDRGELIIKIGDAIFESSYFVDRCKNHIYSCSLQKS